jgi:hypothetical protein
MLLPYNKAFEKAQKHLVKIDNLKKFCNGHNLNYYNVLKIKNNKASSDFPILISKILTIFGNDVTIMTFFKLNKRDEGQNDTDRTDNSL